MATNYLTLTGNYSLNPFKKKDPNALTTPTTNSNTNTVKLSASDLQKANNPYGFSTATPQGQAVDLSPDSLFKTSTPTTTPYKTVADTTPKVDKTTTTTPSALDNYLANLSKLSNTQIGNEKQNYQDTVDFETGQANDQNKALLDSLNSMKTSMDNYTTSTNKNRDTSKATAESQYGLQQLQTAKTRQESEARNRNRFAALNTADSAGAGSYDEAQSNVESDFNKDTQTILQAKQAKLDEINSAADTSIQTQIDKYNDYVRQVNSNINTNNATKAKNIAAAKYALNTAIGNIQANVENLKYQQLSSDAGQLSAEFIKTGIPQTSADFIFKAKNPTGFANKIGATGTSTSTGKLAAKDANIATSGLTQVNNLRTFISNNPNINKDINPLTNREYKSTITNVSDLIGRLRSGGAIQKEEEARFRSLLPTFLDDKNTIDYKLTQLETEFNNLLNSGGNATSNNIEDLINLLS